MSLKAVHVFFVTLSIFLCFGFGVWCLSSDFAHGRIAYLATGYISFALGVGLIVYEVMFLRKFKDMG